MPRPYSWLAALLLSAVALPASAGSISSVFENFEEFPDGEVLAAPYGTHAGYTLRADRFRGPDEAVAVHTKIGESSSTSNTTIARAPSGLGNVLTLAGSGTGAAGTLTFFLSGVTDSLSFDWVNLGSGVANGQVQFLLLNGVGAIAQRGPSIGLTDPSVSGPSFFGDGVHHVDISNISPFNAFQFTLFGSVGIDNISTFSGSLPVPEPSSAGLLGLGLLTFALGRLRRR